MSWSRIKAVYFRYLYTLFKGPNALCDLFYWPFIDILLWGITSVWIGEEHHVSNLPLLIMTGLIFWQIAWRGAYDVGVNLLQEFWHRNLVNLFSTPLKISEWALGVTLLCLCKLIITVSFGALVVFLLYSLNVFTVGWAFIPFMGSLILFGLTLGFISSSAIIYWGSRIEMFAWMIGFLFAPFSAVFYPLAILPDWAQMIGRALPTSYIFEGMRSILNGGPFPIQALLLSFALNLLYFPLAIWLFSYSFHLSRKKGLGRLE